MLSHIYHAVSMGSELSGLSGAELCSPHGACMWELYVGQVGASIIQAWRTGQLPIRLAHHGAWVVFFAYAFYIRRRQADLEREITELADLYAKTDNPK